MRHIERPARDDCSLFAPLHNSSAHALIADHMLEQIEAVSRKYAIAVSSQIQRLIEPADPKSIPSPRNSSPPPRNW
jgi:hypothetical protein